MLRIRVGTTRNPRMDPDIHNPEKVFAFLCYRGNSLCKMGIS